MKTAYGNLALLSAFALAGVAVLVPTAPAVPAPADPDEKRDAPVSVYTGTAIGAVLEANNNEVPRSGEQMMKVLEQLGEFAQLPVTFSAVDLHSGLTNPRVVVTQRPSLNQAGSPCTPDGSGMPPTLDPLSPAKLTRPNLEGRLFLAANMEKKDGALKVRTFEFISWNSRKQKFDFGFITCDEVEPQIRIVDGVKCFSCHKNHGPILGLGPWSNTPHNDVVRDAVATAHKVDLQKLCLPFTAGQPTRLDTGFERTITRELKPVHDGMSILVPQGPAVDAAVRLGADLARDREVYRAMARTADGRKGLVVLLGAIAAPGSLEQNNQQVKTTLDQTFNSTYATFLEKWVAIHKASSSTLVDFNPSGSSGSLRRVTTAGGGSWGSGSTLQTELRVVWGGSTNQVKDYDLKRSEGERGLTSSRQPSNPRAFVKPTFAMPRTASAAVNAVGLARLIGLTEGDRAFLAEQIAAATRQAPRPKAAAAALAKDIFGGPQFMEVLSAGEIPDREDFKDLFVKGLNEALKAQGAQPTEVVRKDYASGPNVAREPGREEPEPPVVATTACVRCHDLRVSGKTVFSPIPLLAFDPFDKTNREAWAKATTDPTKRLPVLARMAKRMYDDRDMPPEDSPEHDTFRVQDAAGFDAVKEWVEAETKKARKEWTEGELNKAKDR